MISLGSATELVYSASGDPALGTTVKTLGTTLKRCAS
jgi:hypothetical protein